MNNSPVTRYNYNPEGGLVRIEAITGGKVVGVWYVALEEALSLAIKQAKEAEAK